MFSRNLPRVSFFYETCSLLNWQLIDHKICFIILGPMDKNVLTSWKIVSLNFFLRIEVMHHTLLLNEWYLLPHILVVVVVLSTQIHSQILEVDKQQTYPTKNESKLKSYSRSLMNSLKKYWLTIELLIFAINLQSFLVMKVKKILNTHQIVW